MSRSLINQSEYCLNAINQIGISKKILRDIGLETGIHSTNQMEHALSDCSGFVRWLKTIGITDLFQLKVKHYRDYIAFKKDTRVSYGHLINIETNLRLLAKGMTKLSKSRGYKVREWIPQKRLINVNLREKPTNRMYTEDEIKLLQDNMSKNARIASQIQLAFGLRLREVAQSRVAHIITKDGQLVWKCVKEKEALNTAIGVTKGGRPRETPCRTGYEDVVKEIIEGKNVEEFVSQIRYNSLRSAFNRAADRSGVHFNGSHGFRHTYAREMLKNLFDERGIYYDAMVMLELIFTNVQNGKRKDAGVSKMERDLYKQVIECLDLVQKYLGHGKGRLDLCEVYLKN